MGHNGRDYVRQNYGWDVILSKYNKLFNGLSRQPTARAR
jgi:hypothetical protein